MCEASVIISFYNNVDALICIIRSLENQQGNFEIIIADDGSKPSSVEQVQALVDSSSLPITHVWQEDCGFRKNRALNKAVQHSKSPYLIFIDGDCVPQSHFVADHLKHRESGFILNGRRVDLDPNYKSALYNSLKPELFFKSNQLNIFSRYLIGKGKNIEKGVRITHPKLFNRLNQKNKGIVGCNFSLHKDDFLLVNGFDNRYDVPSVGEDTDLEYRLIQSGKRIKNIFYQASVLHIIHPELPRLQRAVELFEETLRENNIVALDGYAQADRVN
ncbi:glycosyl transferase [Vibrio qinghaiensis]|uniref:Glycosyl transferase n=1 Tax=Vibrio qinghaiensis TaxID=2025808 RepID=A0A223N0X2_9VIBR|nr:glycosyltransferase [Vibrio qinghaiensis]ASU23357.1 glycosyl transferase [Vibrio qinghaiensis]